MRRRLAALALSFACASCISVTLRELHPDVFYDAEGNLGYCGTGSLRVEERATGRFRELLGNEWDVREAESLPQGGFVFASGVDAPVYRHLGTFDEPTVELWWMPSEGAPVRLTDNLAHESQLLALPDRRSVLYRRELAQDGGGLMATPYTVRRIELAGQGMPAADAASRWGLWQPIGASQDGVLWFVGSPEYGQFCLGKYDPLTEETGLDHATPGPWDVIDASARTVARKDFEQPDGEWPRHFVVWRERSSGAEVAIPCAEHVSLAISPDGERIAILERGQWVVPLVVVGFLWDSATLREYDRAGNLLREIGL